MNNHLKMEKMVICEVGLEMKKSNNKDDVAPPRIYCSTAEAAQSLGVSTRTIQLWVDSGVLAAWKTAGGHRRVFLESVEKLKISGTQSGCAKKKETDC